MGNVDENDMIVGILAGKANTRWLMIPEVFADIGYELVATACVMYFIRQVELAKPVLKKFYVRMATDPIERGREESYMAEDWNHAAEQAEQSLSTDEKIYCILLED
jgi:hypothetical protein